MDRLVFGLRDLQLQRQLLSKPNLTFKIALEEAWASEAMDKMAAAIQKMGKNNRQPRATGVHQESWEPEESTDKDEDIHCLHFERRTGKPEMRERPPMCAGCGENHPWANCKFWDVTCQEDQARDTKEAHQTTIWHSSGNKAKKIHIEVLIEEYPCEMEVDTGSYLTILSWKTIRKAVLGFKKGQLKPQKIILKDYQGNRIPVLGSGSFQIKFKEFTGQLQITIMDNDLPSLLRLEWFEALDLGVTGIDTVQVNYIKDLMREFADIFDRTLGKYMRKPISFNLDPNVTPIRMKPRRVPFALRPKIDNQLDKPICKGFWSWWIMLNGRAQ